MTDTITSKYAVGDRVEANDNHFLAPYHGTVVEVKTRDGETTYTVRKVEKYDDYDDFSESELQPAEEGFVDLDDRGQVLRELRDTVANVSEYYGLDSPEYLERAREYGRVSFLVGRLAWLDACDQRAIANQERYGTK